MHNKKEFLVSFFEKLLSYDIDYCILRGYEKLPEETGRDVDVLISTKNNKKAIPIITKIITEIGWNYYLKTNIDSFFTLICYQVNGDDSVSTIQLDFWTHLKWRGISWCDKHYVLNSKLKHNGLYVASIGSEAAIIIAKELVSNKSIKEKYYSKITYALINDKESFVNTLLINKTILEKISIDILNNNFEDANKKRIKIRRSLKHSNILKYIACSIGRFFIYLHHFFKPKGKVIVFVGPDGSGKTTIITSLREKIIPFFEEYKNFHMRYNILPELKTGHGFSSMKGKLYEEESGRGKKKKKRTLISKLAAWFVVLYYRLEFILGNHILRREKRKNNIVFFDRYFYDHFFQPSSRDLIFPFRHFLLWPIKKPDFIVHLNADPEVVYARKQELSKNEIEQQNRYIGKLLKCNKRTITIDTADKTVDKITALLFSDIVMRLK